MLDNLKKSLAMPPKFEIVLGMLDEYTTPPEDGDYDRHTQEAMKAVYDIMMKSIKTYRSVMNHYRDELGVAASYMAEGKRKMNLTTTNSFADDFIYRYGK